MGDRDPIDPEEASYGDELGQEPRLSQVESACKRAVGRPGREFGTDLRGCGCSGAISLVRRGLLKSPSVTRPTTSSEQTVAVDEAIRRFRSDDPAAPMARGRADSGRASARGDGCGHGHDRWARLPRGWCCSEVSITEVSSSTPTGKADKGRELNANPFAAALFHWFLPVHRQVRVTGAVEVVDDDQSDAYWRSRPPGARRSAVASHQSEVVASRAVLEERVAELAEAFPEESGPPRPPRWGGFRIRPEVVELWEEGADRLHDRLRYQVQSGNWRIERLSP